MGCGCRGVSEEDLVKARVEEQQSRADKETVDMRRTVCRGCEHSEKRKRSDGTLGLTTFSKCDVCGCPIAGKTAGAAEVCPEGRW